MRAREEAGIAGGEEQDAGVRHFPFVDLPDPLDGGISRKYHELSRVKSSMKNRNQKIKTDEPTCV